MECHEWRERRSSRFRGAFRCLRGAGMVNLEPLNRESERQLVYAVRTFEEFRRQFAVECRGSIFQPDLAAEIGCSIGGVNYANLLTLTQQTEALYWRGAHQFPRRAAGALHGAALCRERSGELAGAVIRTSIDQFKVLLGLPVNQNLEVVAETLDFAPAGCGA